MGALLTAGLWITGCGGQSLAGPPNCGNGQIDDLEQCDASDLGGETCASLGWDGGELGCSSVCAFDTDLCEGTGPECGNDVVELGEECDGAELDGQTCEGLGFASGVLACSSQCGFDTSDCSNAGECGDGTLDANEECDGAELDGQTCETLGWDSGTLGCDASCHFDVDLCEGTGPVCGNDAVELGEQCDGPELGGQTCETLGYGGGTLSCDGSCDFDESMCWADLCGNGVVEGTEDCDGNDLDGQDCTSLGWDTGTLACTGTCSFDETGCTTGNPTCGDGVINTLAEECDTTDLGGQDCADHGFTAGTLACDGQCLYDTSQCYTAQPHCGDGTVNQTWEECDGADLDGDTCQSLGYLGGTLGCTQNCAFDTSQCTGGGPTCGDDQINQMWEECDGVDLGGQTCQSLGLGNGTLACSQNCSYDTSNCITIFPVCGDNQINQPSEECDGSDLDGLSCLDFGFLGGTLGCSNLCAFDTSGCTGGTAMCGDGLINQPSEECDGNDLGGATCQDYGYPGGTLGCSSVCTVDPSGCWGVNPVCGDNVVNQQWEECDGPDLDNYTCQALGYGGGTLACTQNCAFDASGCTGAPTCTPQPTTLTCTNNTVSDNSANGDDLVNYWSNCLSWQTTGHEMVYELTPTSSGMTNTVDVHLSGLGADLDMAVLTSNGGGCDPAGYCGQSYSGNSQNADEHINFQITPGAVYYIVIDGFDGATSPFTLDVTCN